MIARGGNLRDADRTMSVKIRYQSATITGLVLAKVGNFYREEPLQTSNEVCRVSEDDRETLTGLFLKPFKNLLSHRFHHHTSLEKHEMFQISAELFKAPGKLLDKGIEIARHLYAKSNHPNIKSGDLCICLVDDVEVDGGMTNAICILKAESVVPFLSIHAEDGDLKLHTTQGINPDKIDKGCLILNFMADQGYCVLSFDRSGESKFWAREFLGLQTVPDAAFLTTTYADIAVAAVKHQLPEETPLEAQSAAAREVITYFDDREHFDMQEFEEQVLKAPEVVAKFHEEKAKLEEEHGVPLEPSFEIAPKEVKKACKRIAAVLRLDTGVEIHIKPTLETTQDAVMERGFDEEKQMKFVKIFYNEDMTVTG